MSDSRGVEKAPRADTTLRRSTIIGFFSITGLVQFVLAGGLLSTPASDMPAIVGMVGYIFCVLLPVAVGPFAVRRAWTGRTPPPVRLTIKLTGAWLAVSILIGIGLVAGW